MVINDGLKYGFIPIYPMAQIISILKIIPKERFYCRINDELRRILGTKIKNKKEILSKNDISRATLRRVLFQKNYWLNLALLFKLSTFLKIPKGIVETNLISVKTKNSLSVGTFKLKVSAAFCRVIGHLLGDGGIHIRKEEGKYRVFYVNNDSVLLDSFKEDIQSLFGDVKIYFRKRESQGDEIWLPSTIGLIFFSIFNMYDCHLRRVPKFVYGLNERLICSVLRALFDDEGYIYPKKYIIAIALANKKLLFDIKKLLEKIGIAPNPIHVHASKGKSIMFYFNVTGKNNIMAFYKKVGFLHPKKSSKLNQLVSNYVK